MGLGLEVGLVVPVEEAGVEAADLEEEEADPEEEAEAEAEADADAEAEDEPAEVEAAAELLGEALMAAQSFWTAGRTLSVRRESG